MSKRRKLQRQFDRRAGWQTIKTALISGSWESQSEKSHRKLILPGYLALDALEKAKLNDRGFVNLHVMNTTTFCLIEQLDVNGSDAIKELCRGHLQVVLDSSDALAGIGNRYKQIGRYGATGEQLKTVRSMLQILDSLGQEVPMGLLIKSMKNAERMIQDYLSQRS